MTDVKEAEKKYAKENRIRDFPEIAQVVINAHTWTATENETLIIKNSGFGDWLYLHADGTWEWK